MRLLENESQRLTPVQGEYLLAMGWDPLVVSLNGEDLALSEYAGWVHPETDIVHYPQEALELAGWIEDLVVEEDEGPEQGPLFE